MGYEDVDDPLEYSRKTGCGYPILHTTAKDDAVLGRGVLSGELSGLLPSAIDKRTAIGNNKSCEFPILIPTATSPTPPVAQFPAIITLARPRRVDMPTFFPFKKPA
jgi:hypothetical protein